jgi:hypothetical protein
MLVNGSIDEKLNLLEDRHPVIYLASRLSASMAVCMSRYIYMCR